MALICVASKSNMREAEKIIQRVKRLIALATNNSTPQEEARNAALQACRLISGHKLSIWNINRQKTESKNVQGGIDKFTENLRKTRNAQREEAGEDDEWSRVL